MDNSSELIILKCQWCGKTDYIMVDTGSYNRWKNGAMIQRAMPNLTADQREMLISKTCGECWDDMFGES